MTLVNKIYQTVFRRTSTFALSIIVGAFFFERAFDQGSEMLFEYMNRGKLYSDVKHKFHGEEEEEDE